MHLQTRSDILLWLEDHPPHIVIAGVMPDCKCELLGGFDQIPPSHHSGWIIIVTSPRGLKWNVAVTVCSKRGLSVWVVDEIPWQHWADGKGELYQGDNPAKYRRLKREHTHGASKEEHKNV
jgi:hypothetical protein